MAPEALAWNPEMRFYLRPTPSITDERHPVAASATLRMSEVGGERGTITLARGVYSRACPKPDQ